MPYRLRATGRALRELRKLPPSIERRIRDAIDGLVDDPRPPGCKKLRGGAGWRVRVGDYRVIYQVDDDAKIVTVLRAGHRRDAYRGR
jgi:mRNA interferase RelE/StbE